MFKKKYEIIIKVDGMSCNHCASKVATTLKNIPNVKKVSVNLNKKQVKILSSEKISEQTIKENIETLGYIYLGVQ